MSYVKTAVVRVCALVLVSGPMVLRRKMLTVSLVLALCGTGPLLGQGPSGHPGNSNIAHLYLAEKNPANFQVVPGGAWGKLIYTTSGPTFTFVFNGHKLDAGIAYTLIYYPDPWPGLGAKCLGSGVANPTGDIHIMGSRDTGSLPISGDLNANPATTTEPPNTGAKIWLVLTSDINCTGAGMTSWHPTEYLFEMQLINYTQTP